MDRENLKIFLDKEKELLNSNNFSSLYLRLSNLVYNETEVADLTMLLIDVDIDFIPYLKVIPECCFYNIPISSLELPEGCWKITGTAFSECTSLKEITLPKSMGVIDSYAFENCSNLEKIIFKGTMKEWNDITFYPAWNIGCDSLRKIKCSDGEIEVDPGEVW